MRPRAGITPRSVNMLGVTPMPAMRSGRSVPVRVKLRLSYTATSANAEVRCPKSHASTRGTSVLNHPRSGFWDQM